jgi:hypothetical protein
MLKTEYKWVKFVEEERNPKDKRKTKVWNILNTKGELLGVVAWHRGWRQYASLFEPGGFEEGIWYAESCHRDTADFVAQVNKEHKRMPPTMHSVLKCLDKAGHVSSIRYEPHP